MFTKKITHSDEFISMPHSSQNLYFHLNMEADDEGFVNGVKRIMRTINANEDDLKILIAKRFVLAFETSSVIVIKHWKLHNAIRNDRFKPTDYVTERAMIYEKENGVYTTSQPSDNQVTTNGMHSIRLDLDLDKVSIDKVSIDKEIVLKHDRNIIPPTFEMVDKYCKERKNGIDAQFFIDYYDQLNWYLKPRMKMINWEGAIRTWENNRKEKTDKVKKSLSNIYEPFVEDSEEERQEAFRKLKEMENRE